jgi:hypothetical protein
MLRVAGVLSEGGALMGFDCVVLQSNFVIVEEPHAVIR